MSSDPAAGRPDPLAWLVALEGVPSAYAATRDGIDVMLRDRGLRRTSPETTAESLLRGAHASAVLEGSSSTLAEVREGAGDEVARDAVRVSTELLSLVPRVRQSPLQAFARIHALAATGSVEPDRLGRPRDAEAAGRMRDIATVAKSQGSDG
ncbi:MAG: oxidoreductase, partial [Nocardioides sp.]|nr:oxidoreductase [Nocardioides sp.]